MCICVCLGPSLPMANPCKPICTIFIKYYVHVAMACTKPMGTRTKEQTPTPSVVPLCHFCRNSLLVPILQSSPIHCTEWDKIPDSQTCPCMIHFRQNLVHPALRVPTLCDRNCLKPRRWKRISAWAQQSTKPLNIIQCWSKFWSADPNAHANTWRALWGDKSSSWYIFMYLP